MKALYKYDPAAAETHGVPCQVMHVETDAPAPDGFYDSPQACLSDTPPTRAELEAKADELGLKYPANISDAKLLSKINEKA